MNSISTAVAAWGLPTEHVLPSAPLDDDAWAGVISDCANQRVIGLLGVAVRDDAFAVSPSQREETEHAWQGWLAHCIRVERLLLLVTNALERAGIETVVLKGVALAHTSYSVPEARVFGDVDILVSPGTLHEAAATLSHVFDAHRAEPELRPGFDNQFAREAMVRIGSIEVDLHRTLVNGAFGMSIDVHRLMRNRVPIALGRDTVYAPDPCDRLLHAAYGATVSDWPPRLVAYRDLAQILASDSPPDEAARRLAGDWRAEAILARGVCNASSALRLNTDTKLLDWARNYRPTSRDRLLMRASRGVARGYTSQLTSLMVIPGLRARLAFVRALAIPSRSYREARGLGRFGLLGRGATKARRG